MACSGLDPNCIIPAIPELVAGSPNFIAGRDAMGCEHWYAFSGGGGGGVTPAAVCGVLGGFTLGAAAIGDSLVAINGVACKRITPADLICSTLSALPSGSPGVGGVDSYIGGDCLSHLLPSPEGWPSFANFAALPAPASPAESKAFNAETLRHYRYTGTERRPVDAQLSVFNLADYSNFQACINAAADYSINSAAAILYGDTVPTTIVLDQAVPLETMSAPINVTIPGTASLVFQGRTNNGYIWLNITITDTPADYTYLVFQDVVNYGTIIATGILSLKLSNGGQSANITVGGLSFDSSSSFNSGIWTVGANGIDFFVSKDDFSSMRLIATVNVGAKIIVHGGYLDPSGLISFNLNGLGVGRWHFNGITMRQGQLLKVTGSGPENLSITSIRQLSEGAGSVLPFVQITNVFDLMIHDCVTRTANTQPGFLEVATGNSISIQNNIISAQLPIAGTTASIKLGSVSSHLIISGNIRENALAHFVDMPALTAAKATMVGNRSNFSVALATNAPAIGGFNV